MTTLHHNATLPPRSDAQWWAWYRDYLQSEEWRLIADKVLARAHFVCEGCGVAPATHVHHLTYAHVGHEFLFELVALCVECHWRIHPHMVEAFDGDA